MTTQEQEAVQEQEQEAVQEKPTAKENIIAKLLCWISEMLASFVCSAIYGSLGGLWMLSIAFMSCSLVYFGVIESEVKSGKVHWGNGKLIAIYVGLTIPTVISILNSGFTTPWVAWVWAIGWPLSVVVQLYYLINRSDNPVEVFLNRIIVAVRRWCSAHLGIVTLCLIILMFILMWVVGIKVGFLQEIGG